MTIQTAARNGAVIRSVAAKAKTYTVGQVVVPNGSGYYDVSNTPAAGAKVVTYEQTITSDGVPLLQVISHGPCRAQLTATAHDGTLLIPSTTGGKLEAAADHADALLLCALVEAEYTNTDDFAEIVLFR